MNFLDERLSSVFWDKATPCPMSGCWLWTACRSAAGYGQLRRQGVTYYAHRVAYIALHGQIPRDREIDHKCRVRCCVNPAHLEAVTHAVNMERSPFMKPSGRGFGGKRKAAHCTCGRAWDKRSANGKPVCVECRLNRQRRWHERRREQGASCE